MQVVRIVDEAFWIYTPAHDIIDEEAIEGQEKGFDRASTASGRDESAGLGQTTATLVDPASGVPDRQSGRRNDPGVGREYWRLQGVPWTQDACDCKLVFRLAGVRRASNSRIPRAPDAAGEGQMNNRSSKYHGEKQIPPDHY
ncbi:hypothetical protein QTP88_013713 [Uroleucon formosanum]